MKKNIRTIYYIAYGSNLNKEQMSHRCPGAKPVGTGKLGDTMLTFRNGVLTIEPREGSETPVAVWEIYPWNEASLDAYEGFPRFYRKERRDILVDFQDGTQRACPAFVYIMNGRRVPQPPTDYYYQTCLRGYQDFGFDAEPLRAAVRRAEAWDAE